MSALSKIEALKQKQAALAAQIRKEQTIAARKERANDTRRKIITGAVVITQALKNPQTAKWLAMLLNNNVTKPADRELLGALLIAPPASPVVMPAVNTNFQNGATETAAAREPEKSFDNAFNQQAS